MHRHVQMPDRCDPDHSMRRGTLPRCTRPCHRCWDGWESPRLRPRRESLPPLGRTRRSGAVDPAAAGAAAGVLARRPRRHVPAAGDPRAGAVQQDALFRRPRWRAAWHRLRRDARVRGETERAATGLAAGALRGRGSLSRPPVACELPRHHGAGRSGRQRGRRHRVRHAARQHEAEGEARRLPEEPWPGNAVRQRDAERVSRRHALGAQRHHGRRAAEVLAARRALPPLWRPLPDRLAADGRAGLPGKPARPGPAQRRRRDRGDAGDARHREAARRRRRDAARAERPCGREVHPLPRGPVLPRRADGCAEQGAVRVCELQRRSRARPAAAAEARDLGLDPDLWFDNVERVAAARIGRETVQYVANIYKYYIAYTLVQDEVAAQVR